MTLREAASAYVGHKRAEGRQFLSGERTMAQFCRFLGNCDIHAVSADNIALFLNRPSKAPATRVDLFNTIRCFIDFWADRGRVPQLSLQRPPRAATRSPPYIYSVTQVRALLRAASCTAGKPTEKLSGPTFRTILATLYATGASFGEVVTLKNGGVDLRRGRLTFDVGPTRRTRTIPICADLRSELRNYRRNAKPTGDADAQFFRAKNGLPLTKHCIYERFVLLQALVSIPRRSNGCFPRLFDLRHTFAVHRITHWIRQGADLNVMLPALSTYMGYSTLTRAEQFLSYAPARFEADLSKLSSGKMLRHWRDNPRLMFLLASI